MNNLFESFYGKSKEVIEAIKKPLVKRALLRKFDAAWDDTHNTIVDSQKDLIELLEKNISDFNLQQALELEMKEQKARKTQELLRSLYKKLFGEEYKGQEVEEIVSEPKESKEG